GGTLTAWMADNPLPPVSDVLQLVRDLALGLAAAHAAGVIHRDLKPANILVQGRKFLIADFGLAKPMDTTTTVQIQGTYRYMSPEQWRPGGPYRIGPPSDIFSLGVILFELLTGTHPFPCPHDDPLAQGFAVWTDSPRAPSAVLPTLDPRLDALCLK